MGNAALACAGPRHYEDEVWRRELDCNQKGRFVVEVAASVLFGIPPLATAYHTSIVVDGEEYFFSDSGMCADTKLISHQGSPSEKWQAGRTDFSGSDLWRALQEHFKPGTYDLLRKNCNSFTDAAMFFMIGKRLDKRYSEAERMGQSTPDMVQAIGMYAPNPIAVGFCIEAVIGALGKMDTSSFQGKKAAVQRELSEDLQSHRIPHLPRPSLKVKCESAMASRQACPFGDITNALPGPGARANQVEAAMMRSQSQSDGDSPSSSSTSDARRPPPRKFEPKHAISNAPRLKAKQPSQPPGMVTPPPPPPPPPKHNESPRPVTPRRSRNPNQLLTQKVYPTHPSTPGSSLEKENLTPRAERSPRGCAMVLKTLANLDAAGDSVDNSRSRSKGPMSRTGARIGLALGSLTPTRILASRGGA